MNLAAAVRANAARLGPKTAILFGEQTISYTALRQAVEAIAAFLHAAGITRGGRVGLAMADHPLHVIAHFAVARLGAVILPIDHRWTAAEKLAAADAFRPAVVLTDGDAIEGVRTLALTDDALGSTTDSLPPVDAADDADVLISLSSGTTGRPKGALLTHRNFYARFESQWTAIGYGSDDCFALVTPLYFGAGRSFAMSMLCAGGTIRLAAPPLKPAQIVGILGDPSVTATFLPPTLMRRLLPLHEAGAAPLLANLDYLLVSGEPLFTDEARECLDRICPNLYSYYASSEGGGISLLTPGDFREFAHTVGLPMPNTEVQIVDENERQVATGGVGRLRYRGPGVATRYIDSDGRERQSGTTGWFYPGDLAECLASGHIVLRGRDKDVIIRGGVNIYPAEIEAVLLQHPDVLEAAVIGRDDPGRGQVVVAYLASPKPLDADDLDAFCRTRLAPYKIPQEIRVLPSLPRRSSGKIDKAAL